MNIQTINRNEQSTISERKYALELCERFDLGLKPIFLENRKKVRNLLHVFGFHNNIGNKQQKYTGYRAEETLRNGIENGLNDEQIRDRLNSRVFDISYSMSDIMFAREVLTNSNNPPRFENMFLEPAKLEEQSYLDLEYELYEDSISN